MKFEQTQDKPPPRYPIVMRFRCSKDDYEQVKSKAAATGHSLSMYLRKRATGGKVSRPIQDQHDLNELRQRMGLLKQLVARSEEVRPLLQDIEKLIALMTAKVKQ